MYITSRCIYEKSYYRYRNNSNKDKIIIPSIKSIESAAFTVPRINSVNLLFSHALGARLGRFRNYVTAQPMQVTISSVFWIFPVFALHNEFSVKIRYRRFLCHDRWNSAKYDRSNVSCPCRVKSSENFKEIGRERNLDFPLDE